jgi:tRNA A37 methylthiotransferase MiaB
LAATIPLINHQDFPDELLQVIVDRQNVCNQLHMPAQSGSSAVLEAMRRGYTYESYTQLIDHIREIIPNVTISSDFIAGYGARFSSGF